MDRACVPSQRLWAHFDGMEDGIFADLVTFAIEETERAVLPHFRYCSCFNFVCSVAGRIGLSTAFDWMRPQD